MSPALAGGFVSTGPSGKSTFFFKFQYKSKHKEVSFSSALATFQMLNSYMWLVATTLDKEGVEGWCIHLDLI